MNLPNKISCIRIALLPVFIFFYLATFIPCNYLIAGVVFAIAAITDFLDGKIARKYKLVTNMGKFLDPIADKLIVVAALILVTVDGTIPNPFGIIISIIIIGRELIISAFRQVAAAKGFVMAADMWGKYKTTFQTIALPLLMLQAQVVASSWFTGTPLLILQIVNYSLIGIATALTIISGCNYIIKNFEVLRDRSKQEPAPESNEMDPLVKDVTRTAITSGKISTSRIQTLYGIAYKRAANIIEQMIAKEYISRTETKLLKVNVTKEQFESDFNEKF